MSSKKGLDPGQFPTDDFGRESTAVDPFESQSHDDSESSDESEADYDELPQQATVITARPHLNISEPPATPANLVSVNLTRALDLPPDEIEAALAGLVHAPPKPVSDRRPLVWSISISIIVLAFTMVYLLVSSRRAGNAQLPLPVPIPPVVTPQPNSAVAIAPPPVVAPSAAAPLVGEMVASNSVSVGSTVSGRLKKLFVAEGDLIKEHQLLAQLDDGQLQAELKLALARSQNANRMLTRTRTLVAAQAATQTELDRATGLAEVARAEVQPLTIRIGQMRIKSPMVGMVQRITARPGSLVAANTGFVQLVDPDQLIAEFPLPESRRESFPPGKTVEILGSDGKRYAGTVEEVIERGTSWFARAKVQDPDRALRVGAKVELSP